MSALTLARAMLALYPPAWRARYGDEVSALLEDSGAGPRTIASLAWHAAPAWIWPPGHLHDQPARIRASLTTQPSLIDAANGNVGPWWFLALLTLGFAAAGVSAAGPILALRRLRPRGPAVTLAARAAGYAAVTIRSRAPPRWSRRIER